MCKRGSHAMRASTVAYNCLNLIDSCIVPADIVIECFVVCFVIVEVS